ncbi:MAG: TIGR02281 family clan AA aspartic protease [Gammaproteobacteria bacterium]
MKRCARLLAALVLVLLGHTAIAAPRIVAVALFNGKAMVEVDGRRVLLREGERSDEGVLLLSSDADGARVEVDGNTYDLALDQRIGGDLPAAAAPIVRLLPGAQGHYFVDGQINGRLVHFLVDTGATNIAINKHTARRIGLRYAVPGERGTVETASGAAVAYRVVFDEVKVQGIRLTRVPGIVIDGDAPRDPLLGQSFLNRLDIHREGMVLELRAR